MLRFSAERWFPKGAEVIEYPQAGLTVGILAVGEGKPQAVGYYGKSAKPAFNYVFRDVGRMQAFIQEKVASGAAVIKYKADQKAARAAKLAEPNPLAVGDILRSSWGYDQTNVDYYQVTALVGKRSVKVRGIAQKSVPGSEGFMSERVQPVPGAFLEKSEEKLYRVGPDGEIKVRDWGAWARKVSPSESSYSSWYA